MNFGYDFESPKPRKKIAEHIGKGFKGYTYLKMGTLAWSAGKRARAKGAGPMEAAAVGARAGIAWFAFLAWSIISPLFLVAVPVDVINYYNKATGWWQDPSLSAHHMWVGAIFFGIPALVLFALAWMALYSKLNDLLNSYDNKVYRAGVQIRNKLFLHAPWWVVGVIGSCTTIPFHVYIGR